MNDQIQGMGRLINGIWLGKRGEMISEKNDFLVLLISYKDVYRRRGVREARFGGGRFCRKTTPRLAKQRSCSAKGAGKVVFFNIFLLFGKSAKRIDYSFPPQTLHSTKKRRAVF